MPEPTPPGNVSYRFHLVTLIAVVLGFGILFALLNYEATRQIVSGFLTTVIYLGVILGVIPWLYRTVTKRFKQ